MCNAVKLPSAPRLKFQNPGQNYSKSEEAKIKILLDNDPQTKITGIMYFNRRYFWNWCIRSTKQITEIIHLWWGETNYQPDVPR